jgi:hypothetical protein
VGVGAPCAPLQSVVHCTLLLSIGLCTSSSHACHSTSAFPGNPPSLCYSPLSLFSLSQGTNISLFIIVIGAAVLQCVMMAGLHRSLSSSAVDVLPPPCPTHRRLPPPQEPYHGTVRAGVTNGHSSGRPCNLLAHTCVFTPHHPPHPCTALLHIPSFLPKQHVASAPTSSLGWVGMTHASLPAPHDCSIISRALRVSSRDVIAAIRAPLLHPDCLSQVILRGSWLLHPSHKHHSPCRHSALLISQPDARFGDHGLDGLNQHERSRFA